MKRIILMLCAVTIASCSSPEKKAEENVSNYIKAKLDDPQSYEVAESGKLVSEKSDMYNDPAYIKLTELYKAQSDHELSMYASYVRTDSVRHPDSKETVKKYYTEAKDSSQSILNSIDKYKADFKPQDIYSMKHKFRAKNKMGGLVLDSVTAYLDKDLKVLYLKK